MRAPGWTGAGESATSTARRGRLGAQGAVALALSLGYATAASGQELPTLRIHPEPQFTIGTRDGSEQYILYHIIDLTELEDGTIVVAMFLRNYFELRYFDAEGRFLASAGRYGDGPFEVGREGLCCARRIVADSVLVVGRDERFSVFGPGGEAGRTGRIPGSAPHLDAVVIDREHLGLIKQGEDWEHRRGGDGFRLTGAIFGVMDIASGTSRTVGASRGLSVWMVPQGFLEHPFTSTARIAAGGGLLVFGSTDESRLQVYRSSAGDVYAIPIRGERRAVTVEMRRRYREHDLAGWTGDERRRREGHLDHVQFPDSMPRFHDIELGPLGDIWVMRYEPRWSREPYRWDVYAPDGTHLGEVSLPFSALQACIRTRAFGGCPTKSYEIGTDRFFAIWSDDLGVERVSVYRLSR